MAQKAYQRVLNTLREQIVSGHYCAGQKLPSEFDLCRQFNLSRVTVRHALSLLCEQGLIERFVKRGTFVRSSRPRKVVIQEGDFSGSMLSQIPAMHRELVHLSEDSPPNDIARILNIGADQRCLTCRRLDFSGKEPLAYDNGYIPLNLAGCIDEQMLLEVDFLHIWLEKAQLTASHTRQMIEAVEADAADVELLDVEPGSPLLKARDVIYLPSGRAVAVFESYYRGERVALACEVFAGGRNERLDNK